VTTDDVTVEEGRRSRPATGPGPSIRRSSRCSGSRRWPQRDTAASRAAKSIAGGRAAAQRDALQAQRDAAGRQRGALQAQSRIAKRTH